MSKSLKGKLVKFQRGPATVMKTVLLTTIYTHRKWEGMIKDIFQSQETCHTEEHLIPTGE